MVKDKRFLVFEMSEYYPSGGMSDMKKSFDDLESAIEYAKNSGADYVDIYDRIEGVTIDFENEPTT